MAQETMVNEDLRASRIGGPKGQAILAATRRVIRGVGVEGATFDAITAEAGVARGAVFWAFGSKERLLLEVLDEVGRERLDELTAAFDGAQTLDEMLDGIVDQVVACRAEDAVLVQEMASIALREPSVGAALAARRERWRVAVAELLGRKCDEGVIALDADALVVATTLTAFGHGLAVQGLLEPELALDDALKDLRCWVAARLEAGDVAPERSAPRLVPPP